MVRFTKMMAVGSALVLMMALTACGDDDDASSDTADTASTDTAGTDTEMADTGGGDGTVNVVLSEWIVEPDPTSAAAGTVEFVASNEGGEAHELVVVKGDDPAALPQDDTGLVLEDELEEGAFIGEIEEFDAGGTESASFDLEAGSYILFCNIVEEEADGTFESHFDEGMVNTFTVS